MPDEDDLVHVRSLNKRRRWRLFGLSLAAVLTSLWFAREPIATEAIHRWAVGRGVPLRYRVVALGPGRQRLADIVVGDPRSPDLVADWIETGTGLGLNGVRLTAVRVGRVRVRAAWRDGRLSFGSLDHLLPMSGGGPNGLPAYDLDVADARVLVLSPAGDVRVALAGRGRLDGGFAGEVTASASRLSDSWCSADGVTLIGRVAIAAGSPRWTGPVGAARLRCGGADVRGATVRVDAALGPALDRWRGNAIAAVSAVGSAAAAMSRPGGVVTFEGDARGTSGAFHLAGRGLALDRGTTAAGVTARGRFHVGGGAMTAAGRVHASDARLDDQSLAALAEAGRALVDSPVGPLAARASAALARAARRFDLDADLVAVGRLVQLTHLAVVGDGGPSLTSDGDAALTIGHGLSRLTGRVVLSGPGVPDVAARVTSQPATGAVAAVASVVPFAAGGASLAFAGPVRLALRPGGELRVDAVATVSGPVGVSGRVTALTVPIAFRRAARGWLINPDCATWRVGGIAAGGLTLHEASVPVCPIDGALARSMDGRLGGGVRLGRLALAGTLGDGPATLAVDSATATLASRRFAVRGAAVRLGPADRATDIDADELDGALAAGVLAGRFAGAGVRIGAVPLVLSGAAGDWRLAGGALELDGGLTVADAATAAPRFRPLPATGVRLTLADGRIAAAGTLIAPTSGRTIATVALEHDLATGRGRADFTMPGVVFDTALQPDALTPLTFGVVADVSGAVTGDGIIAWSPDGVTSTGVFRTRGLDLAAAFGPVTGLATELRFTDLLALETAPHQVATVNSIDPGVPVTDGVVHFQLLPGSRVRVEDARWPFAGGTLALRPTELDLAGDDAKRLTFALDRVDARRFLAQFDFKNLDASGTFDGGLPMVFDAAGGRIEHGRLAAQAGGGTIAYVGELSAKDLGFWGNLAFQSLKSLRYRSLEIALDGSIAGEMVTDVQFAGVSQGAGARSNFLIRRLQRLPLVFNVRIRAPFRGLIDSAQSFLDPSRLVERNLPALIREQEGPTTPAGGVQPPASGTRP